MSNILKVTGTIQGSVTKDGVQEKFVTENYWVSVHSNSGNFPSVPEIIQTYGFIKETVSATLNGKEILQ